MSVRIGIDMSDIELQEMYLMDVMLTVKVEDTFGITDDLL